MRRALSLGPIALLVGAFSACDDDCDDCDNHSDVFFESEPNDDPLSADHFGQLLPGDHFFIEGFITDRGTDPFDGFAFTAGQALHVDFQLFTDDFGDDLDVCLYDPQLDQTLACFATANNPELGGVDVTAGGLDFQLVVESFVGESSYALEIVVVPLFAALAQDGPAARAADTPKLVPVGAASAADRQPRATSGYARERKAQDALHVELEQWIEIDRETGVVLEMIRVASRP